MINFNTLEEGLEISGSEALVVASLDDFNEDCWPILDWLGEYLQKISIVIVVNENLQLPQDLQVLLHVDLRLGESLLQLIVITVRNVEELLSSGPQVGDSRDDVMGPERENYKQISSFDELHST